MLWVSVYCRITGGHFLGEMFVVFINFAYSLSIILIYVEMLSFICRTSIDLF